jgi:hypothetical protein
MNSRVEPAIVRFWVRRRLPLEAKLARLMTKLPLNVALWITAGNCAKCRRAPAPLSGKGGNSKFHPQSRDRSIR